MGQTKKVWSIQIKINCCDELKLGYIKVGATIGGFYCFLYELNYFKKGD